MADLGQPVISTTQAVRACLGLDDSDVPDPIIVDSGWVSELEYRLTKALPSWVLLFTNGVSNAPTTQEKTFADVLKLFGKYFLAEQLSKAPMAFPWMISDGKDQMRRNDKVDLTAVQQDMAAKADLYWQDLLSAYNAIIPITVVVRQPPKIFGTSRPAKDPVTGGDYEAG